MEHETQFLSKFEEDSKSIGFLFMRTYSTWHSQIKNCLKKQSITHPQFIVMATTAYLSQNFDEVTQIMISKKTNIDVMTISQIINKLEEKRFIIKNNSLKDSRARSIKLTADGYAVTNKALPLVEDIDQQFFSSLGEDMPSFHDMLLRLAKI
jgi:DNA-binding MarR family transcriptional regulator